MICNLCGEDMFAHAHYYPFSQYYCCYCIETCDGIPKQYYYQGTVYSPEEWRRLLELKAFW